LNLEILIPGVLDCWCDNIRLEVNNETGFAKNVEGVETRVPFWGSTEGFEVLDPTLGSSTAAFLYMVQDLLKLGYKKNETLSGAPYDFRYSPDSNTQFEKDLKSLIEETVQKNAKKAVLISHSMGGLQTLYFLSRQSPEWKAAHVAHWIPISAPWGGTAKEFRLFATGDSQGLPVNANTIRGEQRSYETNAWMLPIPEAWGETVLVKTSTRNYTAAKDDYHAFFDDIGYPVGKIVYDRVSAILPDPAKAPGVPVSCFYSSGVSTPLEFTYTGSFDKTPDTSNGDGDGTVNIQSLRLCKSWASEPESPVTVKTYEGIDHTGMITNQTVIHDVLAVIQALA